MNKKAIDSLLEAKRKIDDTITQLIRENEAEGKGIMSALSKCEYMLLGSCIIFPQGFLDWCLSRGFLSTATEERHLFGGTSTISRYVPRTDLIRMNGSDITVHPSLLYAYLHRGENE